MARFPNRMFLDTNVLQALQEHGGTIYDGEPFLKGPNDRSGADARTRRRSG